MIFLAMYWENRHSITAGELRRGLEQLPRPFPSAILFGLDSSLSTENTIMLTWPQANEMRRSGKLSCFASHIIDSQPIHIASPYTFWREINGKPMPLFGLEQIIFDVFGILWPELKMAFNRMIWIDEEAELRHFNIQISRLIDQLSQ